MGRILCALTVLLGSCSLASGQEQATVDPAEAFDEQFKKLDRDGDGRLSKEELAGRPFFDRTDADGDGFVTRDEARAALARGRRFRQRLGQAMQARRGTQPAGVEKSADIRYSQTEDGKTELLTLDVYRPANAADLPVMVYVHGGAWSFGDKQAVGQKMPFFCKQGYVFVSVNYRMLPETEVPDQAQDVAAAVAWMHDHAKEFGGNADRMFLMGH